jgi:hypothetical protein
MCLCGGMVGGAVESSVQKRVEGCYSEHLFQIIFIEFVKCVPLCYNL